MSVSLTPSRSLGFRRPLTHVVKRSLTISNQNNVPVAFKVKTTAPKLYCVRPNSGRVEPGEAVDVSVMLQPLREEPPLNSKCKDKFLVQSTLITPERETMALHDLWQASDMGDDGVVHQQKLRVVYLPAEEGTFDEEEENYLPVAEPPGAQDYQNTVETLRPHNGNAHHGLPDFNLPPVPPVPVHPVPVHPVVAPPTNQDSRPPPSTLRPEDSVSREHSHGYPDEEHLDTEVPIIVSTVPMSPSPRPSHREHEHEEPQHIFESPRAPMVQPPPSTTETVYVENPLNEELLAKYREAQAEIDQLRNTIATMSVAPTSEIRSRRSRKHSDAASTADTDVQTVVDDRHYHHQQDGVPLQIVVIVALGVFITTYLFF
ncbi:hypothetical protein Agabi119p4_7480 [Agaricus bisporus var. burnettii]|uniref:MSP domain-containing protein n=1 Tax=Agaricus bisporus var. burnettii TaxID=192524 RepID=A0A8H7C756_AGABI|nr:hypothetical protein Agabi119p4_7480 [Agaricus bisporus var. burnettii]